MVGDEEGVKRDEEDSKHDVERGACDEDDGGQESRRMLRKCRTQFPPAVSEV